MSLRFASDDLFDCAKSFHAQERVLHGEMRSFRAGYCASCDGGKAEFEKNFVYADFPWDERSFYFSEYILFAKEVDEFFAEAFCAFMFFAHK